jgi:hypothetical protein
MGSNPNYPNLASRLQGKLPQEAVDVIRLMNDNIGTLMSQLQAAKASIPAPGLTLAQIKAGLQLGGEQPLDITGLPSTGSTSAVTILGTRANRGSATPSKGAEYYETDTTLIYIGTGSAWLYLSGTYQLVQAKVVAFGATLGVNDTGLLIDVTDFAHVLRWTGTTLTFNDPADMPGRIEGFLVDPFPATGWQLCAGNNNVAYLKSNGTTGTVNLPNLTSNANNAAFLVFGSPSSSNVNAAKSPTLSMNSYTPAGTATFTGTAMNSHQHELPFFAQPGSVSFGNNIYGLGGNLFTVTIGVTTSNVSAGEFGDLSSANSAGTPAGNVSFSGTPATITGNISNNGTPQNIVLRPWFRQ